MRQRWKRRGQVPKELQAEEALLPLVLEAQGGSGAAIEELAWRLHPMVLSLQRRFGYGKGPEGHQRYSTEQREELDQEAWLGFSEAVERFDPGHPAGKEFKLVVYYRVYRAIVQWQAHNSGSLRMPKKAWEQAWHIDKKLEAAGMGAWEEHTDADLAAVTGVPSTGAILRARTPGWALFSDDDDNQRSAPGAEDDYWAAWWAVAHMELAEWLRGLPDIPKPLWEAATYWKLEQLGLAGDLEAAEVVARRHAIVRAYRSTYEEAQA